MQDAPVEFESAQATSGNSKTMIADYPVFLAGPYASMSASGRRSLPSKDDDCARSVDGRGSQGLAKQAIVGDLELELFESFNNRSPAGCVSHADEHLFSQDSTLLGKRKRAIASSFSNAFSVQQTAAVS